MKRILLSILVLMLFVAPSFSQDKAPISLGGKTYLVLRDNDSVRLAKRVEQLEDRIRYVLNNTDNIISFRYDPTVKATLITVKDPLGVEFCTLLTVTDEDAKLAKTNRADLVARWAVSFAHMVNECASTVNKR